MFPRYVLKILDVLALAGHSAFAVGGCVRDLLMGREPHDWDVATDASTTRVMALFDRAVPTGIKYGTVTVILPEGSAEVTTFRRDGEYIGGRKPRSVEFISDIREDLARRDFTVNAMAMDRSGGTIDPFGGAEDLEKKLLRCVGDPERRFSEDALRMFRLLRFHAQLGFECEDGALAALKRLAPLAARLSAERIRDELVKTLLSPSPGVAALMIEYGLLAGFMSENGKNIPSNRLAAAPGRLRLPLFALLTRNAGAVESTQGLMRELRATAREAALAGKAEGLSERLAPDPMSIRLALSAGSADAVLLAAAAGGFYAEAASELAAGGFTRVRDLAVSGGELRALGLTGPETGDALRRLALAVTAGQVENRRPALLRFISDQRL